MKILCQRVVFDGTTHRPIEFEFINEYIIGGEADIDDQCRFVEYKQKLKGEGPPLP